MEFESEYEKALENCLALVKQRCRDNKALPVGILFLGKQDAFFEILDKISHNDLKNIFRQFLAHYEGMN